MFKVVELLAYLLELVLSTRNDVIPYMNVTFRPRGLLLISDLDPRRNPTDFFSNFNSLSSATCEFGIHLIVKDKALKHSKHHHSKPLFVFRKNKVLIMPNPKDQNKLCQAGGMTDCQYIV
jgi:hypothetical protein